MEREGNCVRVGQVGKALPWRANVLRKGAHLAGTCLCQFGRCGFETRTYLVAETWPTYETDTASGRHAVFDKVGWKGL